MIRRADENDIQTVIQRLVEFALRDGREQRVHARRDYLSSAVVRPFEQPALIVGGVVL